MENTSHQNSSFQTQDLYLASALVLSGQNIKDIRRSKDNSNVLVFLLSDEEKCQHIQEQYWQNKLIGNIQVRTSDLNHGQFRTSVRLFLAKKKKI